MTQGSLLNNEDSKDSNAVLPKYGALKGGGLKGVAHLGVFRFLMKVGLWDGVKGFSGCSAGALAALMGATGWDDAKIYERFANLNLEEMITGTQSWWNKIPIINSIGQGLKIGYNLLKYGGMHTADAVEAWVESIAKEVTGIDNCTFVQWHAFRLQHPELKLKDIIFEAGCMNTGRNEVFSYKTDKKDVPIARGARASIAFPGYITPVYINGKWYEDGGVQRNCPVEVFDKKNAPGEPRPDMFCVMLEDKEVIENFLQDKPLPVKPTNAVNGTYSLISQGQSYNFLHSLYLRRAIFCDTLGVGTFDYKGYLANKDNLILSGEYGAIAYFYERDPGLIKAHYDEETIQKALSFAVLPPGYAKLAELPWLTQQDLPTEEAELKKKAEPFVPKCSDFTPFLAVKKAAMKRKNSRLLNEVKAAATSQVASPAENPDGATRHPVLAAS